MYSGINLIQWIFTMNEIKEQMKNMLNLDDLDRFFDEEQMNQIKQMEREL